MSTARETFQKPWVRRALAAVVVLALLSPMFAWAAGQVNYAEPLENAAEVTGASEHAESHFGGVLPDYTVPGTNTHLGTAIAGLVGSALVFLLALGFGKLLEA